MKYPAPVIDAHVSNARHGLPVIVRLDRGTIQNKRLAASVIVHFGLRVLVLNPAADVP